MRRNLLLAEELASATPQPSTLLVTGSREIGRFALPKGVDLLSLPALYKDSASRYHARTLQLALPEIIALRSATIHSAVDAFAPDVFVVDNVPRGAQGELEATLQMLRRRGRTQCVLGLRDILDDPTHVRAEWNRIGNVAAIRQYYDAVLVYGDQDVLDVGREYDFPDDVRRLLRYTGYLDQRRRATVPGGAALPASRDTVVCLLGGGQDGLSLARTFAAAPFPRTLRPVLVTGPMMSAAARAELDGIARSRPELAILDFVDDPAALMCSAHAVITMGGYNTICDVLSHNVRALVVPRVVPRTEQLIRASRLASRGLLDLLHPNDLTPDALALWAASPAPSREATPVRLHDGDDVRALFAGMALSAAAEVRHAS